MQRKETTEAKQAKQAKETKQGKQATQAMQAKEAREAARANRAKQEKLVQVADYRKFKKPYKTIRKLLISMFWEMFWQAQNVEKCKKALDVCKKSRTHKSSFQELFGASKR